jgi:CheY-like chemotaxis protein
MPNRKNKRPYILAVDDENDLLMLLEKSLESQGFEVSTLLNAHHFWETVHTTHPDLIFLDIRMNGINGGDLCNQLKKDPETAAIPVVILSASHNLNEVAKHCGADGFVSKPYSTEKIVSEIRRILH